MESLKNFAGNAARVSKPFKRVSDLTLNKKYAIIQVTNVVTNFGPRFRIETEDFKFELPARFNSMPEEAKIALLTRAKFITYKGRDREEDPFAVNLFDFEGANHFFIKSACYFRRLNFLNFIFLFFSE